MSLIKSAFKFIYRKKKNALVFIPGWATDYNIFNSLDLDFNYLVPFTFSPFDFEDKLLESLKENNIFKASILGLSLGGFLAAKFSCEHKNLVDNLFLVSIRKKYPRKEIDRTEKSLKKSPQACLYKFYRRCLSNRREFSFFKKFLLKKYCCSLSLDYLLEGLCYLRKAHIEPSKLSKIKKIKIVHGEFDNIVPLREALEIKNNLKKCEFLCIKGAGHFPFLAHNFKNII